MKLLNSEEEDAYAEFMNAVANSVFKESVKYVREFQDSNVDPLVNTEEIGMAVGHATLEVVTNFTKDMSREEILKWFTEVAIVNATNVMQSNPAYKIQLAILNGLL